MEVLAEYAINFIYKLGHIRSIPDALLWIPILHAISKPYFLLEAVYQAQSASTDKEFLGLKSKAYNPTSVFLVNQWLTIILVQNSSPIVTTGDANQLKQTILTKLYTSPLGGHLGHCKLLELVCDRFWQPHLNSQLQ